MYDGNSFKKSFIKNAFENRNLFFALLFGYEIENISDNKSKNQINDTDTKNEKCEKIRENDVKKDNKFTLKKGKHFFGLVDILF